MSASLKPVLVRPLKVGLFGYRVIMLLCAVFFGGCSVAAFFAKQYGPSAFFWMFILMSLWGLVATGDVEFDDGGVGQRTMLGRYRMHWKDVQGIEIGAQGTLVLQGQGKRFVLVPSNYWSGPDKREAIAFVGRKAAELGLDFCGSAFGDFKMHKNVKVHDAAPERDA